jgi:hypothetical protein
MSWQLMNFVRPITDQLESLQNQCAQLAALHDEAQRRLRLQGGWLTNAGGIDAFVGAGATEFASAIEFYISISDRHMQLLDEVTGAVRICASEIIGAAEFSSSVFLDDGMVAHVLGQLTHENLIREGGDAVDTIINEMRRTLDNMRSSGGNFFGHVFQGHYGSALHDVSQELAYAIRLYNEAGSLLDDVGRVLYNWGQSTGNAVNLFLNKIGPAASIIDNLLSFIHLFDHIFQSGPTLIKIIPKIDDLGVLGWIAGNDHSIRELTIDVLGSKVGEIVGGIEVGGNPIGLIVISALEGMHIAGPILAWQQNLFGNIYGGPIGNELKRPIAGLKTTSENIDPTTIFNDSARLVLDSEGLNPTFIIPNIVAGVFGVPISEPDQIPSDTMKTLRDLWKLGTSIPQFIVLVKAVNLEDQAAVENVVIQNMPLLSKDFKHSWSVGTVERIKNINDVTDVVLHPTLSGAKKLSPVETVSTVLDLMNAESFPL